MDLNTATSGLKPSIMTIHWYTRDIISQKQVQFCFDLSRVARGVRLSLHFRAYIVFGRKVTGYARLPPEVPATVPQVYKTYRSSERVQHIPYPYPECCGQGRRETSRSSGYRYECRV